MHTITIYRTQHCPFCHLAADLLARKGAARLTVIAVDIDPEQRNEMVRRSGRRTVPQIFIGDVHVGGYDDLVALERQGRLDDLLNQSRG